MQKAVFLDRDGIINIDTGYVHKIEDFEFNKNIFEILRYLQEKGFLLFIITNQSGIAREYFKLEDFYLLTNWMINKLKEENIELKSVEFCPHKDEDNCNCRKPKTGMIDKILAKYKIDKSASWLIGDKVSDIECGIKANISNTVLFDSKKYDIENSGAKFIINDLLKIKEIL